MIENWRCQIDFVWHGSVWNSGVRLRYLIKPAPFRYCVFQNQRFSRVKNIARWHSKSDIRVTLLLYFDHFKGACHFTQPDIFYFHDTYQNLLASINHWQKNSMHQNIRRLWFFKLKMFKKETHVYTAFCAMEIMHCWNRANCNTFLLVGNKSMFFTFLW